MKKKVPTQDISRHCGAEQFHFIVKIYLKGMRAGHCALDFRNTWVPCWLLSTLWMWLKSSIAGMLRFSSSALWCCSHWGADACNAMGRKKVNCSCANPFLFFWDNAEDSLGKLLISLEAVLHVATGLGCVHSFCSTYFYVQSIRSEGDAAAHSAQRWHSAVWLVASGLDQISDYLLQSQAKLWFLVEAELEWTREWWLARKNLVAMVRGLVCTYLNKFTYLTFAS